MHRKWSDGWPELIGGFPLNYHLMSLQIFAAKHSFSLLINWKADIILAFKLPSPQECFFGGKWPPCVYAPHVSVEAAPG